MVRNGFNDCNARQRISGWTAFPPAANRVVRVTFSSRISNCLRTAPRSFCENSSTTRIFHRPGGLTERIASRNSTAQLRKRPVCKELHVLFRTMVIREGEDMLNKKQIQVTNKGKCVAVLTGFHTYGTTQPRLSPAAQSYRMARQKKWNYRLLSM